MCCRTTWVVDGHWPNQHRRVETVEFGVVRSSRYVVRVTANATTHSLSLGWETFDCNERVVGVRVAPDSRVETSGFATALGCSTREA